MKSVTIIGGGPAALMLAAQLNQDQYSVSIYDRKKTVGRKFLVAGEGGLNLSYSSSIEDLISKYHPSKFMEGVIRDFSNEDLMLWLKSIDIPTFVGSSNRVFPDKELKPAKVLKKIVDHVSSRGTIFHLDKQWKAWTEDGKLLFENGEVLRSDIVVFSMGGASWKVTGSDGTWRKAFIDRGIKVQPFRAVNCAFEVDWIKNFISTHRGKPLKNIALRFGDKIAKGELVITEFGLEGNALYELSQDIQNELLSSKSAEIYLDLKPTMSLKQIRAKYKASSYKKVTEVLKNDLNLDRTAIALLKQCSSKEEFVNPDLLTAAIKNLAIVLKTADILDAAISTLGGVALEELDSNFQLKKIPNSYAIGEMLDWSAPTGGYLLQGCFSMGFALAKHLNG